MIFGNLGMVNLAISTLSLDIAIDGPFRGFYRILMSSSSRKFDEQVAGRGTGLVVLSRLSTLMPLGTRCDTIDT
jgi:hypothetical protein